MIIVKIGGAVGNTFSTLIDDLSQMWETGRPWVLVHGGSAYIDDLSTQLGHPPQFVTSPSGFTSRRTDHKTVQIYTMALAGQVNTQIVVELQARGVNAIGLSGLDGRLLEGSRKKAIRAIQDGRRVVLHDDYTGTVERVNADLLRSLLQSNYAPIICPPALSYDNEPVNVDSDRAAAAVAIALGADSLVVLTSTPGLLRDGKDPSTRIATLKHADIDTAISTYAKGRMRHKLLAALAALNGGVNRVYISASTEKLPVQAALHGAGTLILQR